MLEFTIAEEMHLESSGLADIDANPAAVSAARTAGAAFATVDGCFGWPIDALAYAARHEAADHPRSWLEGLFVGRRQIAAACRTRPFDPNDL